MRDKTRISNIMKKLQIIWENNPDMRFFQLLAMIGFDGHHDYFYLEDDILSDTINKYLDIIEQQVED